MTDTIPLAERDRAREAALTALRKGRLVQLPTDTVEAVIADAFQPRATTRLLELKGRGRSAPLSVMVRAPRQVSGLVEHVPEAAERLMASYWPGPMTIVFPAAEGLLWDLGETAGTVALRMPTDDFLLDLVAEIGPLSCTGAPAPHAERGNPLAVRIEAENRQGEPSTVVDVTRGTARVLRPGAIASDDVQRVADGMVSWGQRPTQPTG